MSEILPSTSNRASLHGAARIGEGARPGRASEGASPAQAAPEGDRVELSEQSRLLSQLRALPEVRAEMVAHMRGEIATDAFFTDARIDGAVTELARDLDLLA